MTFWSHVKLLLGPQPVAQTSASATAVRGVDSLEDFSANLYAPILISGGRGHQVINQTADAPVRAPLFQRPATEERVHAA